MAGEQGWPLGVSWCSEKELFDHWKPDELTSIKRMVEEGEWTLKIHSKRGENLTQRFQQNSKNTGN